MKTLRFYAFVMTLLLAVFAATTSAWADGPDRTCPESCVEPLHPSGPWIEFFKATPTKGFADVDQLVALAWKIANCGADCQVSLLAQPENTHAQAVQTWRSLAARASLKVAYPTRPTRYVLTAVSPRGKARQSIVVAPLNVE